MNNIGVFAANFNPISLDQINFLKKVKQNFNINKIYMLPINFGKDAALNNISIEHKRSLCSIAIKNLDYVMLCDENLTTNNEITAILKKIKSQNINSTIFLIAWPPYLNYSNHLNKIYTSNKVAKLANVVSVVFFKTINKLQEIFPQIEFKPTKIQPTFTRKLRIMISMEKDCSCLLDKNVLNYIRKNNLYHGKESIFLECYDVCRANNSKRRFSHCNFVAQKAQELAKQYGENELDAKIAGILHDVLKEKSKEYMMRIFKTYGFRLSETQKLNPKIWHGLAGAIYIEKILGLEIKNIVQAVKHHTVPSKNMNTFEKIIFMADRISDDRKYKDVQILRKLSEKDLDSAILYSLKNTIFTLLKKESTISIPTVECFNTLIMKKRGIWLIWK